MNEKELREYDIQDYIKNKMTIDTFQYRFYKPNALKLLKPSVFINKVSSKFFKYFLFIFRKKLEIKLKIKFTRIEFK